MALTLACLSPSTQQQPGQATEAREAGLTVTGRPLRIATSGDYAPFSAWPQGDERPTGFSAALAEAFAQKQGRPIEWVRFEWRNLLADLAANRFDLALSGITLRPDRSTAGRFSLPITTSRALVLVPAESPWHSPADLDTPGRRLAVNRGGHLERVARSQFPKAEVRAVDRNEDVLKTLGAGADGVVTDSLEAPHWQARRPGLRIIGPITRDLKAALFPPAHADLAEAFDRFLHSVEASGELAALRARHGLPDERTAAPAAALVASLDERLSLMPAVADAKRTLGLPIEDRPREQVVIEAGWRNLAEKARQRGQAPPERASVEALFRAQIEAAKWIQRKRAVRAVASARAATGEASGEASASDRARAEAMLRETLRPALIRLGNQIAMRLLSAIEAQSPPPTEAELAIALSRHGLPKSHRADLAAALAEFLEQPSPRAPRTGAGPAPALPRPPAVRGIAASASTQNWRLTSAPPTQRVDVPRAAPRTR